MQFSDVIMSYIKKMKHQSLWGSHDLCEVLSAANLSQTPYFYNELLISSVHAGEIRVLAKPLYNRWPQFYPSEIRLWAKERKFKLQRELLKQNNTDTPTKVLSQTGVSNKMNLDNLVCLDKFDPSIISSLLDLGIQDRIIIYAISTATQQFFQVIPIHIQHIKSNLPERSVICFNPKDKIFYPSSVVVQNYIASGDAQFVGINALWVDSLQVEQVANAFISTKSIERENIELKSQLENLKREIVSLEATSIAKEDPRSQNNAKKLIALMATDGYGYDPTAKKSPLPAELSKNMIKIGQTLSRETIKKIIEQACYEYPTSKC